MSEIKGPDLWGKSPDTRIWLQIADGSHTAEQVEDFKRCYRAAGWTRLQRSSPFANKRHMTSQESLDRACRAALNVLPIESLNFVSAQTLEDIIKAAIIAALSGPSDEHP